MISTPIILHCRIVADSYRGARRGLSGASSFKWIMLTIGQQSFIHSLLFLPSFLSFFLIFAPLLVRTASERPELLCFAVASKPEQWTTNIIICFLSYVVQLVQFYCIKIVHFARACRTHVGREREIRRAIETRLIDKEEEEEKKREKEKKRERSVRLSRAFSNLAPLRALPYNAAGATFKLRKSFFIPFFFRMTRSLYFMLFLLYLYLYLFSYFFFFW